MGPEGSRFDVRRERVRGDGDAEPEDGQREVGERRDHRVSPLVVPAWTFAKPQTTQFVAQLWMMQIATELGRKHVRERFHRFLFAETPLTNKMLAVLITCAVSTGKATRKLSLTSRRGADDS